MKVLLMTLSKYNPSPFPLRVTTNLFFVYIFSREIETECEWERVRETGRHRI